MASQLLRSIHTMDKLTVFIVISTAGTVYTVLLGRLCTRARRCSVCPA